MYKVLKMKLFHLFVCLSMLVLTACNSTKTVISQENLDAFNNLVASQNFEIESDWLYPQASMALQQVLNSGILSGGNNANSVSLIGNSNFLKISGDSISSYLPFYGERQMNVSYGGSDSTIEFEGTVKNYKAEKTSSFSFFTS